MATTLRRVHIVEVARHDPGNGDLWACKVIEFTVQRKGPSCMVGTTGASQSVTLHVGRYGSFDSAELGKFQKKLGVPPRPLWYLVS
jgi:hypothetical protein